MPPGVGVSGLESDGGDQFFRGGGKSGKVRSVPRPKRSSARGKIRVGLQEQVIETALAPAIVLNGFVEDHWVKAFW